MIGYIVPAVTVIIRICIVTRAIPVCIDSFCRIGWEGIIAIVDTVIVVIVVSFIWCTILICID